MAPAQAAALTESDRSVMLLMSRFVGPRKLTAYGELLRDLPTDPTDGEFDRLPPTPARTSAPISPNGWRRTCGGSGGPSGPGRPGRRRPRGARVLAETTSAAMRELYNPAQVDVLVRLRELLRATD